MNCSTSVLTGHCDRELMAELQCSDRHCCILQRLEWMHEDHHCIVTLLHSGEGGGGGITGHGGQLKVFQ